VPLISPCRRHLPRRPDRQLQRLAQCAQIRIPWPDAIVLPEVYALDTDADLFGGFNNRQATLDPSVTEMSAETGLSGQCSDPQVLEIDNILTADLFDKPA
jgi:hypothetical protein